MPVVLGDGIDGLSRLNAGSVSLLLSDLPSGETRADFDRPVDLERFWPAAWRAVKPGGVVVLLASRMLFAADLVASQRKAFRYDLVWAKTIAGGFLNAHLRPLRAHEYVLVFSLERSTYNPQMRTGLGRLHSNKGRKGSGENYNKTARGSGVSRAGATDRHPWSILPFASVGTTSPERKHPQQKPVPLLRWCVRTYSNPGELVADITAGSGATERAASAEGRRFIGWDLDPRFGT